MREHLPPDRRVRELSVESEEGSAEESDAEEDADEDSPEEDTRSVRQLISSQCVPVSS